jgi:hypothetical protein
VKYSACILFLYLSIPLNIKAQKKEFTLKNNLFLSFGTSGYSFLDRSDDRELIWTYLEDIKSQYKGPSNYRAFGFLPFSFGHNIYHNSRRDWFILYNANFKIGYTFNGKLALFYQDEVFSLGHITKGITPPPGKVYIRYGKLSSFTLGYNYNLYSRLILRPEVGVVKRRGGEMRYGLIINGSETEAIFWDREYDDWGMALSCRLSYFPFAKFEIWTSMNYMWFYHRAYTGGATYFYGLIDAGTAPQMLLVSFGFGHAIKMPSVKKRIKRDKPHKLGRSLFIKNSRFR